MDSDCTHWKTEPVIALQTNNVVVRWPCLVDNVHRAPACLGCVEKSDAPLTPSLLRSDGTVGDPDVCWECFAHLAPELASLHDAFDRLYYLDPDAQEDILAAAMERLNVPKQRRHDCGVVVATSRDMAVLAQLVALQARDEHHYCELHDWKELGTVSVDSGCIAIVDPCRGEGLARDFDETVFAIEAGDRSWALLNFHELTRAKGIEVRLPFGDGAYVVEGRFGPYCGGEPMVLHEVRIRFVVDDDEF